MMLSSSDIVAYQPKKFHNKFEPSGFKYDGNYDTDKIKEFLLHETYDNSFLVCPLPPPPDHTLK